jgi:hypothetical protein
MSVTISCSIQGGLVFPPLTDGAGNLQTVVLNGPAPPSSELNPGFGAAGAGLTSVDATVWSTFSYIYGTNPLITSGAVYQV